MSVSDQEGPVSVTDRVAPGEPAAPAVRRPRPVLLTGACALVGAIVAVVVLLIGGWRPTPVSRYEVQVFLDSEVTPQQREKIRVALNRLPYKEDARPRTREEDYAEAEKVRTAIGNPLPDTAALELAAESLMVPTRGRDFDCSPLVRIMRLPGVAKVFVNQYRDGEHFASIAC